MKVYLIWAIVTDEGDAPWLIEAWDEHCLDGNEQGYLDAIDSARAEHGAGNIRITTCTVDYDKVVQAFKPVDVTPAAAETMTTIQEALQ